MDGIIADLKSICDLADEFNAMVMVDDSHAVGFIGENGRGTPEYCGVEGRVHIITGTMGKALGGASGGFVAAHESVVEQIGRGSCRARACQHVYISVVAVSLQNHINTL